MTNQIKTRRRGRSRTRRPLPEVSSPNQNSPLRTFLFCILVSIPLTILILVILHFDEISLIINDHVPLIMSRYRYSSMMFMETITSAKLLLEEWKTWIINGHNQPKIYTLEDMNMSPICTFKNALQKDNYRSSCRDLLTTQMKQDFEKDGVIVIRGLLSEELLNGLKNSSRILLLEQMKRDWERSGHALGATAGIGSNGKQFYATKMGASFLFTNTTDSNDDVEDLSGFRNVALSSILPQISAELMGMDHHMNESSAVNGDSGYCDDRISNHKSIRVLRDVFLAKDDEPYICGWHVDDEGYWPTTYNSTGINTWIAIDDMPPTHGGGFALSIGSHSASWAEEARNYIGIGSSKNGEKDGYESIEDMFNKRGEAGTCNLKLVAPELNRVIEGRKIVFDVKAGDVIFVTRWLFHRTVAFDRDIVMQNRNLVNKKLRERRRLKEQKCRTESGNAEIDSSCKNNDDDDWNFLLEGDVRPLLYRRYSVRYSPGIAKLPNGFTTEMSVLSNSKNQGQTLDSVGEKDGPWYPECWPFQPSNKDIKEMQDLVVNKFPDAEKKRKEIQKRIAPHLQKVARKQRHQINTKKKRLNS